MSPVRKAFSYVLGDSCAQENHILPINAMQYASGRGQLYTGGRDGVIKVWDCTNSKENREIDPEHGGNEFSLQNLKCPDQNDTDPSYNASLEENPDVDEKMLKLETSISSAPLTYKQPSSLCTLATSRTHNVHFDWINDLKLVNNDRYIVSASSDLSLKLVDLEVTENNIQRFLNVHTDYIQKLSSIPSQNTVVSGGLDGMVVVWDLATLRPACQFSNINTSGPKNFTSIYALSNDNKNMISVGGPDSLINIYDQRVSSSGNSNLIWKLVGHQDTVRCLLMNSQYILSGSSDSIVKLWDLRNFSIYKSFEFHDDAVWNLCTTASSGPGCLSSEVADFKVFYSGDKAGNIVKTDLNYLSTHSSYEEPDPYGIATFSSSDYSNIDERLGVSTLVAKTDHPVVALCTEYDNSLFVSTYSSLERYYIPDTGRLAKYQYLRTCMDYAETVFAEMEDDASSGLDLAATVRSELDSDFYDIVSHLSIELKNFEIQSALSGNISGKAGIYTTNDSECLETNIEHFSMFLDVNGGPSGEFVNVYKDPDGSHMVNISDSHVDETPVEILLYPVSATSTVTIPFNKSAFQSFPITSRSVISKRILNNKRQLLALYCNGDILKWDIVVAKEVQKFPSGRTAPLSVAETRTYLKKLDDLLEEHQTQDTLNNWCEVDIRAGKLLVLLGESYFGNVEVYYDDLLKDYSFVNVNETHDSKNKRLHASNDDRFWISRIFLNSIFYNYATFEAEADKKLRESLKSVIKRTDLVALDGENTPVPSNHTLGRHKLFNKAQGKSVSGNKVATSTAVSVASNISEIALDLNQLDEYSEPVSNSLTNDCVMKVLLFNKNYYREFYTAHGTKRTVPSLLKLYSIDLFNEEEDYEHRPLIAPEYFPSNLTFFIFELSPDLGNFRDLCSFTMQEISSFDTTSIAKTSLVSDLRISLPRWIGKTILQDKFPGKELPKVAFQLFEVDYGTLSPSKTIGGKSQKKIKKLPMLESSIKLSSHSLLRVDKILMFVVEKFGSKTPEMKSKKLATEWMVLECRGIELEPKMTLQTIKAKIWKSSLDIELHFRRKFDN